MRRQIENISKEILSKLYECSVRHVGMTWSFQSAFRACGRSETAEIQHQVFEFMGNKGWIEADNGFPPYDVKLGIEGPDLSGETAVRLTDIGKQLAIQIHESRLPKSVIERVATLPVGKGVWEVIKLSLAALFGALAKSYFG